MANEHGGSLERLTGQGISKTFGQTLALSSVNIELRKGTITALIGPTGSGKTTLLKCLALLERPDSGSIHINQGQYRFPDEDESNSAPPWPRVTLVFQDLFLWPHLTVKQNILLPLGGTTNARVAELVRYFAMESFLDRYPGQISGGQRQLGAIVRAIALDPEYLLLDEVTAALDIERVASLLEKIQELRDEGVGILLVTHALEFARRAADKVLFLCDGSILEDGGPSILSTPTSPRLSTFLSQLKATT